MQQGVQTDETCNIQQCWARLQVRKSVKVLITGLFGWILCYPSDKRKTKEFMQLQVRSTPYLGAHLTKDRRAALRLKARGRTIPTSTGKELSAFCSHVPFQKDAKVLYFEGVFQANFG